MSSQQQIVSILIKSRSYQDFLREAFRVTKETKRGFSLAVLAQKVGCRSKSYPREVMTGRRSLSLDYAQGFANAFGLKGDAKKLFLKYVEHERRPEDKVREEIQKIRARLRNRIDHTQARPKDLFNDTLWIDIYAGLGSMESGATLRQICIRTGLPTDTVLAALQGMIAKAIVSQSGDAYLPVSLHHFFEDLGQDKIFQKRYLEILDRLRAKARISTDPREGFFYCSTISIKSSDMQKFRSELKNLIGRFVQDAENAEGDKLAHLAVGMV